MQENRPPDEWEAYREVIASFGSPERLKTKLEELDKLIEERNRRLWLVALFKGTVFLAVPVFAMWQILKDFVLSLVGVGK